jgi:EAL domain-containing protein (putative c-di-GMP-specific phosphodiesterase class I)
VRNIVTDKNDVEMIQVIIFIAMNYELNIIAEGVETEAQLTILKRNGCIAFQGYYFGRPVPIEVFDESITRVERP